VLNARALVVFPLLWLLTFAAMSATAHAQADDGVIVDPDSAPAKEYALPLDSARNTAGASAGESTSGGGGVSGAAPGGPPPVFGSGITAKGDAAKSRPRTAEAPTARSRRDRSDAADDAADTPSRVTSSGIEDGGGTGLLYSVGGALVVVAAGGLLALTLRRRHASA